MPGVMISSKPMQKNNPAAILITPLLLVKVDGRRSGIRDSVIFQKLRCDAGSTWYGMDVPVHGRENEKIRKISPILHFSTKNTFCFASIHH
jgi:hypothetical protein